MNIVDIKFPKELEKVISPEFADKLKTQVCNELAINMRLNIQERLNEDLTIDRKGWTRVGVKYNKYNGDFSEVGLDADKVRYGERLIGEDPTRTFEDGGKIWAPWHKILPNHDIRRMARGDARKSVVQYALKHNRGRKGNKTFFINKAHPTVVFMRKDKSKGIIPFYFLKNATFYNQPEYVHWEKAETKTLRYYDPSRIIEKVIETL